MVALLTSATGCRTAHSGPEAQAAALPAASAGGPMTADDMRVDDAEVTDGLTQLTAIVNEMADSIGSDAAAREAQDRIEPVWSSIEGTVKANEPDTYVRLEDEFALIQKTVSPTDPVKARAAADAVVQAADGYLDRHPGGIAPGSGDDPAATPSPSAVPNG
jgi:hypothetical protein